MKLFHLDAYCKTKGYPGLVEFLTDLYLVKQQPLEAVADELGVGITKLRHLLATLRIEKPAKEIPLTYHDARRLSPDDIARAHKVSRSTAWRWKRAILSRGADDEVDEGADALDVAVKLGILSAPPPSIDG